MASFVRDRPADQLEVSVREIRLELEEPTQRVRAILDCTAPEAELRRFLELFAAGVEAFLLNRKPPGPGQ
jgi:hypothetical protein